MSRYFFHIREGGELHRDSEGQEFANVEAARQEAINSVREILGEKLLHGGALNHRSIEIADETGRIVEIVNSRDVLIKNGQMRSYPDDITQSATVNVPPK